MKRLTSLIGIVLFTMCLNAQFIVNNTNNSFEEYVKAVNTELDLDRNIKINFNVSETNTALYVISDEDSHTYDVYIRQTNDKLFYCELIAVAILRIKEIDSNINCVAWNIVTANSQKLAYKYQHLYK